MLVSSAQPFLNYDITVRSQGNGGDVSISLIGIHSEHTQLVLQDNTDGVLRLTGTTDSLDSGPASIMVVTNRLSVASLFLCRDISSIWTTAT